MIRSCWKSIHFGASGLFKNSVAKDESPIQIP
jgi:hypothetical protein